MPELGRDEWLLLELIEAFVADSDWIRRCAPTCEVAEQLARLEKEFLSSIAASPPAARARVGLAGKVDLDELRGW